MKNDLTNQRFGRLLVIQETEQRKNRSICWLCLCDCGNEKVVSSDYLVQGKTQSCGCLHIEEAQKTGRETREHFGCFECGNDKHYAKGLCRNCYEKRKRSKF
jgi:hypothetical protein